MGKFDSIGGLEYLAELPEKVPTTANVDKYIKIVKVDIDKYPELARNYGVMSIPCIILFDNGNELKRNIGYIPENKLKEFIK